MGLQDELALGTMRPCVAAERPEMLAVINAAAQAYRGAIPPDRWREPYMPALELASEIADGVVFSGCEVDGALVGVMGVQRRGNVDLIRHAYVLPAWQGRGVGSRLMDHLRLAQVRPLLVGTWRAAVWAVSFYKRHGFTPAPDSVAALLLRTYWTVPERQIATSLVLARPGLDEDGARRLVARERRGNPPFYLSERTI